ncbi:MAG: CBS domain-containing protein [Reyranellaceae bacterium]
MLARDIMTTDVCTVGPQAGVEQIAKLLIERNISAVVVVDDDRHVVGLVSEGDLMRRCETDTDRKRSRWRMLIADNDDLARDYRRSHAVKAHSLMSRQVICVDEDTGLGKIADIFERRHIKRVPVTREGRLVGIVSRRDLVRAFVAKTPAEPESAASDDLLRGELDKRINREAWAHSLYLQTLVRDGVVEFFGFARSEEHIRALTALAEAVPGVKRVRVNLRIGMPSGAA